MIEGTQEEVMENRYIPEDEKYIDTDDLCPTCGKGMLKEYHTSNGPMDYNKNWTCPHCGDTWSE